MYLIIIFCKTQKQPPEVFIKEAVLKNFAVLTGKQLCWSIFVIKLQAVRSANFFKKRPQHRCFPVNIARFLRTPMFVAMPY